MFKTCYRELTVGGSQSGSLRTRLLSCRYETVSNVCRMSALRSFKRVNLFTNVGGTAGEYIILSSQFLG